MRLAICRWVLLSALLLSGCGFHLRGHGDHQSEFPFKSLYLKLASESAFTADLRHQLELNKLELLESPTASSVIVEIISEQTEKQILSISSAGRVQEFQLRYVIVLRAYDTSGQTWLQPEELSMIRSLTYDDAQVLAKEQEELLLYRDMRVDAVQQVLRRLGHAKPKPSSHEN
jgi:LPS-assembly lipoprotein